MKHSLKQLFLLTFLLSALIFSAGCTADETLPLPPSSTATTQATRAPAPTNTPSPPEPVLYIDPAIPAFYQEEIIIPADWTLSTEREAANIAVSISPEQPQAQLVYSLAAPFNTIDDDITSADLKAVWQGEQGVNTSPSKHPCLAPHPACL